MNSYRVRAPELVGQTWLNAGGRELQLKDLRGKIVLLDFWTFCCINCLHVIDEMRPLEEEFADVLEVVGVHSPKFEHEADIEAVRKAVDRYDIEHLVLNDPELETWQRYGARAWPTLVVIDPEGYVVGSVSGEGHVEGLRGVVSELVTVHEQKGTLRRGDKPVVPEAADAGVLRFPGKVLPLPSGNLLVSDTGHHSIVELAADGETFVRRIGSGERGFNDGSVSDAQFNEPQGLALVPAELRASLGYDVLVADTVNHRIRGIDLSDGSVRTVAGSGVQRLIEDPGAKLRVGGLEQADPLQVALSSPWDIVWDLQRSVVVIAMSGTHQIWDFDPIGNRLRVLAGSGVEGLLDGSDADAWFAQSSGLSVGPDGTVWVADSETSALREIVQSETDPAEISLAPTAVAVKTPIGVGLFDFGYVDGPAADARLQHPLGVTVLPDGSIAIADTYNGAIRRYDPNTDIVSTIATDLAEPSDVIVDTSSATEPLLIVVESNLHRLVRVSLAGSGISKADGKQLVAQRPRQEITSGELTIDVNFVPPAGEKLDDRFGDPTVLKISATPENLLVSGAGSDHSLTRTIRIAEGISGGVLHISARAASCDAPGDGGEIPEHAACHLYQQDWGIPVEVRSADHDAESNPIVSAASLVLDLRGVN